MRTIIDLLHLIGITFWVGGLFVNTLVLMPSLRVISPAERGKLLRVYLQRFAILNWGAVVLVGVTGLLATNRTIGFTALFSFDSSYGNILLAKILIVILMILNGVYLGAILGPRMTSLSASPTPPIQAGPSDERQPTGPPPELLKLQRRMTLLSWVQVLFSLAVLLLAALL